MRQPGELSNRERVKRPVEQDAQTVQREPLKGRSSGDPLRSTILGSANALPFFVFMNYYIDIDIDIDKSC